MTNEIPPLGGYKAVADILGTTRQNIYNKWERMKQPSKTNHKRSHFPAPYTVTVDGMPLWNIDEIDKYARKNKLGKYNKEPAE